MNRQLCEDRQQSSSRPFVKEERKEKAEGGGREEKARALILYPVTLTSVVVTIIERNEGSDKVHWFDSTALLCVSGRAWRGRGKVTIEFCNFSSLLLTDEPAGPCTGHWPATRPIELQTQEDSGN